MRITKKMAIVCLGLLNPVFLLAQSGITGDLKGLQGVLDQIYAEMLPLCGQLIGVGRGLAGFAATWYIAYRVWRHIASAEPVDFYPLLRPFVLGFAISIFPAVIGLLNGVLQPTVSATAAMVEHSDDALNLLLKQKEAAIENTAFYQMYVGPGGSGDIEKWEQYTNADDDGLFSGISNGIKFEIAKASYDFRNSIKEWLSEVLQLFYAAAALCINTIRTFFLIVLAILGPLVFGISVFDGLHHTLNVWIARYVNIFLWLPIANIFGGILGTIEQKMVQLDINQIQQNGDTYFGSLDAGYLIFLLIGIAGYFTIPSLANHIINAGSPGALLHKTTRLFGSSSQSVVAAGTASLGMATDLLSSGATRISDSISSQGATDRQSMQQAQSDKITGKTKP